MTQWLLRSIIVCLTVAVGSAQSLRDRAKQQGGRATTVIDVDYGVMKVSELIAASDVVLRGSIISATPHLRVDEAAVVTDYVILPIDIVKQRRLPTVSRPGESTDITIRRPGGSVVDGALSLSTDVNVYPESEMFKVGEEVIVFLQYDLETHIYHFTAGPFGAFRVMRGQILPATREVVRRRGDTPVNIAVFMNGLRRAPQ